MVTIQDRCKPWKTRWQSGCLKWLWGIFRGLRSGHHYNLLSGTPHTTGIPVSSLGSCGMPPAVSIGIFCIAYLLCVRRTMGLTSQRAKNLLRRPLIKIPFDLKSWGHQDSEYVLHVRVPTFFFGQILAATSSSVFLSLIYSLICHVSLSSHLCPCAKSALGSLSCTLGQSTHSPSYCLLRTVQHIGEVMPLQTCVTLDCRRDFTSKILSRCP
jgi:hypothetical protein